MIILDLFSGTHSISKAFPNATIISVDLDPHFNPTHNVSILEFDYKQYDHFDYIHASPPCTNYSVLQTCWLGKTMTEEQLFNKVLSSDILVMKTLEIIEFFKPRAWTIENPFSNWKYSLVKRPIMNNMEFCIVNYCQYGYPVKKPTVFFNNFGLKLLLCDKKHKHVKWDLAFSNNKKMTPLERKYNRYKLPPLLCDMIASQVMEVCF